MSGNYKKVQFFQCKNETQTLPTEGWIPPFGLAYIATYAKQQGHQVSIYSPVNGDTLEEMLSVVGEADIVGITTTAATYHTSLTIARTAKSRNPQVQVVFGGPESSALSEEVVLNRGITSDDYCIDVVCCGDSVSSFVDGILGDKPLKQTPNLVFIRDNSVIRTSEVKENISCWPCIDYSFFKMDRLVSVYGDKFKDITPFKRGLGVISEFGCAAKHQCGFCARMDRKLRLRPVEHFWQEISLAMQNWGVEYFFDLADSILCNPAHLKRIIEAKPKDISPYFRVFSRADQLLDPGNLDLLEELGTYEVFVGFESGSGKMLKAMNKDITPEQNLAAARVLGERGIHIVGCFVLGAPGETKETLEESVKHAESIQKVSNNHLLVCGASPVNILPGSPWFACIKHKDGILGQDDLDRNFLRDVWYSSHCPDINAEIIEDYAEKIRIASGATMQYEKGTDKGP